MNYHLMIDEKFIDDFIADAQKQAPGNNTYLVSLYAGEPRFAKSPLITYTKSMKKHWFSHIAPKLKKGDRVFIHWLDRRVYDIVLSLPPEIEVGIFSWMGDLIATPLYLFERDILKPQSYAFFNKHKKRKFVKDPSRGAFYNSLLFVRHVWRMAYAPMEWRTKKEVMRRMNLFFHWNAFDYEWVKVHYPGFHAQFVYFFYDVGFNGNRMPPSAKKADAPLTVWLGNSATIPNNHFEALDDMAHLKNENIEIVCPLSYGERADSEYTQQIVDKGRRIFGEKFKPLLAYLNRDEYYALFNSVDVVVMNHIRSQAAGNVFMFLKFGKPVFMDPQSTLYRFLRSKNVENVYMMSDLTGFSFHELKMMVDLTSSTNNFENMLNVDAKAMNLKKYLD